MREACLYNNWSFVPIFLKIYRALKMNTLEFLGGGGGDESPRWGHSPGVEGRGMRALSQILSDKSLSYSLKHISTEEHSLHISRRSTHLLHLYFLFSWWRHQMETCSASLGFVRGIHRWLRGIHRSPVNSPHTDQWRRALMFALICAWTNGWVNNQDAGEFEAPLRTLWRHCNVVPNSDPMIRAAVGWFGVQRVTLVQFWIGETGQFGGFRALWKEWPQIWHTALPWLPFLEINYILHTAAVKVCGVRSSRN